MQPSKKSKTGLQKEEQREEDLQKAERATLFSLRKISKKSDINKLVSFLG